MTQQHPITPSNLSPQAWAVLEAAYQAPDGRNATRQCVAAALRAAADQVVPTTVDPRLSTVRSDLMRIAAELEAQ
jgi:hypothetical protein